MKRYIAHLFTDMVGTDAYEAILAANEDEAQAIANEMALDNAASYGIGEGDEYDDDYFSGEGTGASVAEYNSAIHDRLRSGGGSFETDFNYLES